MKLIKYVFIQDKDKDGKNTEEFQKAVREQEKARKAIK